MNILSVVLSINFLAFAFLTEGSPFLAAGPLEKVALSPTYEYRQRIYCCTWHGLDGPCYWTACGETCAVFSGPYYYEYCS
ncbi:hypothetical protein L596_010447 [Steinernema carpocapsae]|uniref:Uncharacterized protein n=1 Tax=Steinernema carpocapsae TaxID=34508 RepID=A0A4U5PIE8_STECR|nr:hypothetical protein L596_010447 [Steinernema carpocapsae]